MTSLSRFIKPLRLDKLVLPSNVMYSPLAGCSDYPFRKMASKYRPGLIFCEMVKMDALVRNDEGTLHILDYSVDMHPIGAQLCGSKPSIAGQAARMIQDLGFDVVDLNCGCPVDKVTKDGSGSGMLKDPRLIGDVVSNIVAAVSIPVTVKIRAGWDEKSVNGAEITRIVEQAGAKAITVHGRTRAQGYKGPAKWHYIKECKEAARDILVIGNGDVMSAEAAFAMMEQTGCDGVMASRGTMGQPWLADDIYRMAAGEPVLARTMDERRQELAEHFSHMLGYHHERRVVIDMRRVGCWYFTHSPNVRGFRSAISKATSLDQLHDLIQNYTIGEGLTETVEGDMDQVDQQSDQEQCCTA
jgi:tRNA-dihydrouridine synthase B